MSAPALVVGGVIRLRVSWAFAGGRRCGFEKGGNGDGCD